MAGLANRSLRGQGRARIRCEKAQRTYLARSDTTRRWPGSTSMPPAIPGSRSSRIRQSRSEEALNSNVGRLCDFPE